MGSTTTGVRPYSNASSASSDASDVDEEDNGFPVWAIVLIAVGSGLVILMCLAILYVKFGRH